jgi:hypothetical protein
MSSGGTSLARSSLCLGEAPPLPATKRLKPFSVAMRPKLENVSLCLMAETTGAQFSKLVGH